MPVFCVRGRLLSGPEKLRERFIGDEKEIEILCPMCGTKHKGKIEEEISK